MTARYPDLAGRVAVVTGGSKGIGAATCRALVENDVRVAVVARSAGPVDALVAELRDAGGTALGVVADVRSSGELARVRARVHSELGSADLLVAFAGGFSAFTPVWEIGDDEWRTVIEDNLTSCAVTVRSFVPSMIERGGGSIVTMSSISGRFLDKTTTASYAAAKAGVAMYTRHAAIELGPHGIRVNSIAPGTVASERIEAIMDEEAREGVASMSPLGRIGVPEDCANATLFLLSESAGWMTGVTLDVTGGRVML